MLKINSAEIVCANSILEMFNGNAQFVIENPWFEFDSHLKKPTNPENYLNSFYDSETKNGKIHQLNTPRILFKEPKTNKFTMFYEIKWGDEKPKTYWITIASKDGIKPISGSQNFFILPLNSELTNLKEEDLNLCKLDRQLTYGFDIAIALTLLNLDPKSYQDDVSMVKAMYTKITTSINETRSEDQIQKFADKYLNAFNDPKIKTTYFITEVIQRSLNHMNFKPESPLIEVFKQTAELKKENKFKQTIQLNHVLKEDKEEKFYFNSVIKFNMKENPSTPNNKYQTKLVSITGNKTKRFNLSTNDMLCMFSEQYPTKTVKFGYIKLKPTFTFKYIDNPQFSSNFWISWTATTICLQPPRGLKIDEDTQLVLEYLNTDDLEIDESI